MPRRSARNQAEALFELAVSSERTSNLIVGDFMKKQMLELLKETKKELPTCDICTLTPCECCITWLCCGHVFCSSCVLRLQKNECPVCKWTPP